MMTAQMTARMMMVPNDAASKEDQPTTIASANIIPAMNFGKDMLVGPSTDTSMQKQ